MFTNVSEVLAASIIALMMGAELNKPSIETEVS
jgi:hypothetical protein